MAGSLIFRLVRPVLSAMDAEQAHGLTIRALALGFGPRDPRPDPPVLATRLFGIDFPNPVGLAAGFDKNAEVPDAMLAMGLGFAEVGTVTPLPQAGNPKPRMFRLADHAAVINRLGFNNDGHAAMLARLTARAGRPGLVGVNIGANKDSADRIADYAEGIKVFAGLAAFFTVNISSPNTPGLRALQERGALEQLLSAVMRARAQSGRDVPVLLKLAPDLEPDALAEAADVALAQGLHGLILGNTTITRPNGISGGAAGEAGGLSGAPLAPLARERLRQLARAVKGRMPLVAAGGINSGAEAYARIRAGASLVELYTALAYQGPGLIRAIKDDLAALLIRDGFDHVADAVGADLP